MPATTLDHTIARVIANAPDISDVKPMPTEKYEAHISRIQDLFVELEYHAEALASASQGPAGKQPSEACRWVPSGTRSDVITWLDTVKETIGLVVEESDITI